MSVPARKELTQSSNNLRIAIPGTVCMYVCMYVSSLSSESAIVSF